MSSQPTRSFLAHRDGRLFLAAQALDSVAIGVAGVALPWLVLARGGSTTLAGLIYPVTIVPYVIFGLPAGAVGDRFEWRPVIAASHSIQGLVAFVIPVWALVGSPPIAVVLLAAFTVGSARVFADAAAFGAVASVVGREEFVRGQSALSAVWSAGFFAGPLIGGVLVAVTGPAEALFAEASAFVIATLLIVTVRTQRASHQRSGGAGAGRLREGLRFIARNPDARTYTLVGIGLGFATSGTYGLQIPLLRDVIGLSPSAIGWLLGAAAVAGTLTAGNTAKLDRQFGGSVICAIGLAVLPLAVAGLSIARNAASTLIALVSMAAVTWGLTTICTSERQRQAPNELQARVGISGRMLVLGSVTAGATIASALSDALSIRHVYLLMSTTAALVALTAIPALAKAKHRAAQIGLHGPALRRKCQRRTQRPSHEPRADDLPRPAPRRDRYHSSCRSG